jgi:hypothetical protein
MTQQFNNRIPLFKAAWRIQNTDIRVRSQAKVVCETDKAVLVEQIVEFDQPEVEAEQIALNNILQQCQYYLGNTDIETRRVKRTEWLPLSQIEFVERDGKESIIVPAWMLTEKALFYAPAIKEA